MTKEQREKLLYQPKNGYDRLTKDEEAELNAYCEAYKAVSGPLEDRARMRLYCHPRGRGQRLCRIQARHADPNRRQILLE